MKRRLFSLMAEMSLVLCLLWLAAWIAQSWGFTFKINPGVEGTPMLLYLGLCVVILVTSVLLVAIKLGSMGITSWRSGRRAAMGHCRSCGYDLRASKERCPECGTAIAVATTKLAK